MLVQRYLIKNLMATIEKSSKKTFDIQTQYKLIKLKQALQPEIEILDAQIDSLSQFFEIGEDGNYIYSEDGGIKIKEECIDQCNQCIREINSLQITLPDIFFTLEELAPLELTLDEVEQFYFCIK